MIRTECLPAHPHVLVVTIDSPPVNALAQSDFKSLGQAFGNIADDGDIRCVILTSAGSHVFVAGSDTREHIDLNSISALRRSRIVRNTFHAMRTCAVPVLVAVNGVALGAGLVLAACADVIISTDSASFGLPEIDAGVMGGANHLGRLLSGGWMRWMALSGERVSADMLWRHGAIQRLTKPEDLMPEALAMADKIAQKSPLATRLLKEVLHLSDALRLDDAYHVEQLGTAILLDTAESAEVRDALREKRPPKFT